MFKKFRKNLLQLFLIIFCLYFSVLVFLYLNDVDHEIASPDVIDQASSQTEKTVEMRTINRQIKLLSKIDKAIKKINDNTYGYCEETGEPIGLKRLIARPIATLSIEAQEKHEKNEKIFADV